MLHFLFVIISLVYVFLTSVRHLFNFPASYFLSYVSLTAMITTSTLRELHWAIHWTDYNFEQGAFTLLILTIYRHYYDPIAIRERSKIT